MVGNKKLKWLLALVPHPLFCSQRCTLSLGKAADTEELFVVHWIFRFLGKDTSTFRGSEDSVSHLGTRWRIWAMIPIHDRWRVWEVLVGIDWRVAVSYTFFFSCHCLHLPERLVCFLPWGQTLDKGFRGYKTIESLPLGRIIERRMMGSKRENCQIATEGRLFGDYFLISCEVVEYLLLSYLKCEFCFSGIVG